MKIFHSFLIIDEFVLDFLFLQIVFQIFKICLHIRRTILTNINTIFLKDNTYIRELSSVFWMSEIPKHLMGRLLHLRFAMTVWYREILSEIKSLSPKTVYSYNILRLCVYQQNSCNIKKLSTKLSFILLNH